MPNTTFAAPESLVVELASASDVDILSLLMIAEICCAPQPKTSGFACDTTHGIPANVASHFFQLTSLDLHLDLLPLKTREHW